jgi:hypothetical protein
MKAYVYLPIVPFSIVTELIGSIVNGFLAAEVFSNKSIISIS